VDRTIRPFVLTWTGQILQPPGRSSHELEKNRWIPGIPQEHGLFHRLLLLAATATICVGMDTIPRQMLWAQQIAIATANPGMSPVPVVMANSVGGDPYATAGIQSPFSWIGGGTMLGVPGAGLPGFAVQGWGGESLGRLWLRGEYLHWWTDGMDVPALVTTSPEGTLQNAAAVLGENGTSVLFGNQALNDGSIGGFRTSAGFWISPQRTLGIEGEYFQLGQHNDRFAVSGDGAPILGRPFFDIVAGQETAQLLSFPGLVAGSLAINSETDLRSFLINGRASLCPTPGPCFDGCGPYDRTDWIVGYRRLVLKDDLLIQENLESQTTAAPGSIVLRDRFRADNEFNGLQLGVVSVTHLRNAWLESMLRVAVGNNTQTVRIEGSTDITEAGITEPYNGGLLAQRSNIGSYERDEFTMIPEVGLKLGVRLTDRAYVTVGYSMLYFPNVVRAGNQIDTDVNPNLVPPEVDPFAGALRPRFRFIQSDYLAHGINLGGELRF